MVTVVDVAETDEQTEQYRVACETQCGHHLSVTGEHLKASESHDPLSVFTESYQL